MRHHSTSASRLQGTNSSHNLGVRAAMATVRPKGVAVTAGPEEEVVDDSNLLDLSVVRQEVKVGDPCPARANSP